MTLLARKYSDLDLNFTKHPVTGDIVKKKDISAIASSIYNLFQTSHYERLFQPDLGCSLKNMLFEPVDNGSTTMMRDIITQTIVNFEQRVKLQSVDIEPDPDRNGYRVFITFFYANSPEPVTVSIFLERIR